MRFVPHDLGHISSSAVSKRLYLFICFYSNRQVSVVLRVKNVRGDLVGVAVHQRSRSDLQEVPAPAAGLQREGTHINQTPRLL